MSGTKALKKLYKKIVGSAPVGNTVGRILSDLADNYPTPSQSEIPEHTASDSGKLLGVASNGSLELKNPVTELPAYSAADVGKVLTVKSDGTLEFAVPASGSEG